MRQQPLFINIFSGGMIYHEDYRICSYDNQQEGSSKITLLRKTEETDLYHEKEIISEWVADMYERSETDTCDVNFALSLIGDAPKRILEIACGSGRILVPLAEAGHLAAGLDFDECMLTKLSIKSQHLQNLCWKKCDVIQEEWGTGYDVVLLAANFLSNIVADMDYAQAQALVIEKAANALVPGGHLLIDYGYTLHPENWFDYDGENIVWQGTDSQGNTGKMSLLHSSYDSKTRLNRFLRRFELVLSDGTQLVQEIPSVKHFATLEQIHSWLAASGFALEQEYGGYDRQPISETTNRAILWARKK